MFGRVTEPAVCQGRGVPGVLGFIRCFVDAAAAAAGRGGRCRRKPYLAYSGGCELSELWSNGPDVLPVCS